MDPDAALAELLELVGRLNDEELDGDWSEVNRIGELVEALDGWLSKGGFLPARWDPPSRRVAAAIKASVNLRDRIERVVFDYEVMYHRDDTITITDRIMEVISGE